jgi:mRNA-degrading endonuclease RelE of RelBE toxin-antitoxin system
MPYEIDFAASVKGQLETLTARQRATVLAAIEQQLTHEPLVETRNRKLLRPNPLAPWELRVGQLRVFYDVSAPEPGSNVAGIVHVLAVGTKKGNVLWIGERKVDL